MHSTMARKGHSFARLGKDLMLTEILFFFSLLTGCTFNHNLTVDLKLDNLPASAKESISVGMYYTPEMSTATYARLGGPHRYIFSVGKDSVDLFDRVAAIAFKNVVLIDSLPPFKENNANVDIIIEPEIEAFHFRMGLESDAPEDSIVYRLHFYTKEGVPLGNRAVTGKQLPLKSHFTVFSQVDDNMEDAAGKVLQVFYHLPNAATAPKILPTQVASDSGLSVIVEPVQSPLRLANNLSIPITEAGIIAVNMTVRNNSDRRLSVGEANIRLVLPGGRTIGCSGFRSIPSRLEQRSYTGDVSAGLLGPIFGLLVWQAQSAEQNARRLQLLNSLSEKMFGERILGPAEQAQGLVFFMPAKSTPPFTASDLSLWILDSGAGTASQIRLPITGLQFGLTTGTK